MSIVKSVQNRDGIPLGYHRVLRVIYSRRNPGFVSLTHVSSWVNEAAFLAGATAHAQETISFAGVVATTPTLFDDVEQVMIADPTNIFFGGTFQQDVVSDDPLAMAKLVKWSSIKTERSVREYGTYTTQGGQTIDIDLASQGRIQSAYNLAVDAKAASTAFSIDWTLKNDNVVTLNANQMIALGKQVYSYITALHDHARVLRAVIVAAGTVEEVNAIVW